MKLGRMGVWYAADKLEPAQWSELIGHVERLGFGTQWYSESIGFESMSFGAYLLSQSKRISVGSSIANIYARDATASRAGTRTLNRISDGRYVLGLGVSHVPLVEGLRGHVYGKPIASMRAYLEAIREGQDDADTLPIVIAALGPRMLEVAAELTLGAIPYNVTPQHTAQARRILGPNKQLAVEQKFCLSNDPAAAHELARKELSRYMSMPNYRNNWLRLGFTEKDLEGGGNKRFLNSMVVWGNQSTIEERIKEHFDAGADHVCIQPVHPAGDLEQAKAMIEALAPV